MNERQFKNYIKELLKEDDGGGGDSGYGGFGYGGDFGGYGGMGGMYMMGSNEGLYNTFVKPFVEVIQTTSGATKEVMRRVGTAATVALETVVTTFVPIVTDSYDVIFEYEKRDIEALREKYKEIYASNMEMFSHADMNVLAFSISPTRYLTSVFLRKSPKAAMKAMEILSGDSTSLKYWFKRIAMLYDFTGGDREWQKQEWEYSMQRRRFDANASRGGRTRRGESVEKRPVLVEADEAADTSWKKDALADIVAQMMNDKNVVNAIENSSMTKNMHDDAVRVIEKLHSSVKTEAEKVNHITNFGTLKGYVKASKNSKAIAALDNFEKSVTQSKSQQQPKQEKPQQPPPEQKKEVPVQNEVEDAGQQQGASLESIVPKFVTQAKRAIKGIFGSGLDSHIKAAKAAGMTDDSEIVQILKHAKQDVENLNG